MTPEELDDEISLWQSRIDVATENVLALRESSAYKRLTGQDGWPQVSLEGETQARTRLGLAGMEGLFSRLLLVKDVVERAAEMRRYHRWGPLSADRLHEMAILLNGDSIELASEAIPLAERSLLEPTSSRRYISPSQLFSEIIEDFEAAKCAVVETNEAWEALDGEIQTARQQLGWLQKVAQALRTPDAAELAGISQNLDDFALLCLNDPLRARRRLKEEVQLALDTIRLRLGDVAREKQEIEAGLLSAAALLRDLEIVHLQCEESYELCRSKIQNPPNLIGPLAISSIHDLTGWLEVVKKACQQKRWRPARVGLNRWTKEAQKLLERETSALAANREPLEQRTELRGRFSALQAKAVVLASRGAVFDEGFHALEHETRVLLHQKPTSLERASEKVEAYERHLLAVSGSGGTFSRS